MKEFYNKYIRNIFKDNRYFRYLSAFLVVIVFITSVSNILVKQSSLSPENPIEGIADNVSNVALAGSSSSTHDEDTKEKDEDTKEKDEEVIQEEYEEDMPEEDQQEEDKLKDQEEKSEKNKDKTSGSKQNQQSNQTNDNETPIEDNAVDSERENKDSSNIDLVEPDKVKEPNNNSVNVYFTTTIKDSEMVTNENYSFAIMQKDHGLNIEKTEIILNGNLIRGFNGVLKLKEEENFIRVSITYVRENGKTFSVSREYTVNYNLEDIVINTNLKDEMKTTNPELSFTASAKRGNKNLETIVKLSEKELKKQGENNYKAVLKEGENKISISAQDQGNSEEKIIIVNYNKDNSELIIITDIKSYQEIEQTEFKFNAVAKVEDRRVDVIATQNGSSIEGDKDGNYNINLLDGSNYIILKASDGEKSVTEQYEVKLDYRPEDDEELENPNKPIIDTDLKSGVTIKTNKHNIWVKAKDYNGKRLDAGHIEVKANSGKVPINWADGDQTSYTLPIVNGTNQILITVWDDSNNLVTEEYLIKGIVNVDGDVVGHATFSVEASTIGIGNIISPTKVEIRQGEPASYVLDRLLKEKGISYSKTGSLDRDFYLEYIGKLGLVSNPNIPKDLEELLQQSGYTYDPENYQADSLGQFDFSQGAGWMYSVNGHYPNYGFADKFLVDGDVVRIRFTLAYGRDINGSGGMGGNDETNWGDW